MIALFIIIATGATLYVHHEHTVNSAADAARALAPFAGRYAEAAVRHRAARGEPARRGDPPVTAAYVIAESFGFEKGVEHRPREAPVFVGVITVMIAIGTIVAMIPGLPVIALLVGVQVVNGFLLPINLFFIWRLASQPRADGRLRKREDLNILAAATVIGTSALSLLLLGVTFLGL